jgi:cell wall-associated NlpC family hydrolase
LTQAEEAVAAARSMLGMRWRHQARDGGTTDCAGVVLHAAKTQGFLITDIPTDYQREASPEAMVEVCRQHLIEVTRAELRPGDIVVLRYPTTNHIGIVGDYPIAGHLSIIHAQATHPRCVVENRFCDEWLNLVKATVAGCFRFPEVKA